MDRDIDAGRSASHRGKDRPAVWLMAWGAILVAAGCRPEETGPAEPGDVAGQDARVAEGPADASPPGQDASTAEDPDAGPKAPSTPDATTPDGDAADEDAAPSEDALCNDAEQAPTLGIASWTVGSEPTVTVVEGVRLEGDAVARTPNAQNPVAGLAGLRWQRDRMFLIADTGFWDIPVEGPARFYPTPTLLIMSAAAHDIDADGDQDLVLVSLEQGAPAGDAGVPLPHSRIAVWERTPEGLHERTEVLDTQTSLLGVTYEPADVDTDGDLDILTFERGTLYAYVNDGSFGFTRTQWAEPAPQHAHELLGWLHYADRNQDGIEDLLVFAGEELEIDAFVMLGDEMGGFGPPGPALTIAPALVPYGPNGIGIGFADVTGDGTADILRQDSSIMMPTLQVYPSEGATTFGAPIELSGLGFELADIDEDGILDIVSTQDGRLIAYVSRGAGTFELLELGVDVSGPEATDFVVDPGVGDAPAVAHILYRLPTCSECPADCSGRCLFDSCLECLSDSDCAGARCEQHLCQE